MREVCVGRQPIFDRARKIAGWELLYRSLDRQPISFESGDQATATALINAVVEIGLEHVAESEPVFINCTRTFLANKPILPPDRCVLEVLENIEPDQELLGMLERLRAESYTIALDDFVLSEATAPLVELADIIKLDLLALGMESVERHVHALKRPGLKLLAEKVDSEEALHACDKLGFDLFQGYYLRRPDTVRGKSVKLGHLSALTLSTECRKQDADLNKITKMLSSDATLSFKMLQLANSAIFDSRYPIESIPQAISVIGLDALARWSMLLMLSGIDCCPASYLRRAVERGRMCELLARLTVLNQESAYLTGLLSILDAAFNAPIADIAPQLPVSAEIKSALLERTGDLGDLLALVLAYETSETLPKSKFPLPLLEQCFWEAAAYAKATAGRLESTGVAA